MLRKPLIYLLKRLKFLPPETYIPIYYEYYTGKKLDLKNPKEFNQKIQWLKVFYRKPILNVLVDKYAVRSYVEEKIGAHYLNDLIAVFHSVSEVDIDKLPEKFVLKAAHGYNFNLIVKDKNQLDRRKANLKMHKWMNRNQYWRGGLEWAYKDIKPKIIAEKYLEEIGKEDISDYKFYCFDGVPKFIQVDIDRATEHKRCYYDTDWKKLPFNNRHYTPITHQLEKPNKFEKMLEVCTKLAADFPFVRVDLYNLNGKILFGEMTFYPGDGRLEYEPDNYNKILGEYLILPEIPKHQKYIVQ